MHLLKKFGMNASCTYCFSEGKIYKEIQRSYIKLRRYCKEYKNQLGGRCLKYPVDDNDNVIFYICTLEASFTRVNVV